MGEFPPNGASVSCFCHVAPATADRFKQQIRRRSSQPEEKPPGQSAAVPAPTGQFRSNRGTLPRFHPSALILLAEPKTPPVYLI
jgi:hypothetical protein